MFNRFHNPRAMRPFYEPLVYTSDKLPGFRMVVNGCVMHGAPDSQSAGHPLATSVADPWTVSFDPFDVAAVKFREGDRLERVGKGADDLTVQEIIRDDAFVICVCTAKMRSPL